MISINLRTIFIICILSWKDSHARNHTSTVKIAEFLQMKLKDYRDIPRKAKTKQFTTNLQYGNLKKLQLGVMK